MESLFVMAQVAPTEYPKDNLEKADSLVKEAAEKYHPGMILCEIASLRLPALPGGGRWYLCSCCHLTNAGNLDVGKAFISGLI